MILCMQLEAVRICVCWNDLLGLTEKIFTRAQVTIAWAPSRYIHVVTTVQGALALL